MDHAHTDILFSYYYSYRYLLVYLRLETLNVKRNIRNRGQNNRKQSCRELELIYSILVYVNKF